MWQKHERTENNGDKVKIRRRASFWGREITNFPQSISFHPSQIFLFQDFIRPRTSHKYFRRSLSLFTSFRYYIFIVVRNSFELNSRNFLPDRYVKTDKEKWIRLKSKSSHAQIALKSWMLPVMPRNYSWKGCWEKGSRFVEAITRDVSGEWRLFETFLITCNGVHLEFNGERKVRRKKDENFWSWSFENSTGF